MNTTQPISRFLSLLVILFVALAANQGAAQTLTLNNQIYTTGTLANTAVTMTGTSELHITGTGSVIPGTTVNLASIDSYLFFDSVPPSVTGSTYLSSVMVNGSAAVLNTNTHIVEYSSGAVIIPQSSTYAPLQVFSSSNYGGAKATLNQYTTYTDSNLGTMKRNIGSFILKRGYQVTFAQNTNGTGYSVTYTAQDFDIRVEMLPALLFRNSGFLRVTPWHWIGKKGWAGADNAVDAQHVLPSWCYDWGNGGASTTDCEYVPMIWGPSSTVGNTNSAKNVVAVLNFNEPDSSSQSNTTVAVAIADWPEALGSGLRTGTPAPTDGGDSSWLYPFTTAAKAAGLRYNFSAAHFYRGANTTAQLYSFCAAIYENTVRPLWLTEWNNGANWTDTTQYPTMAQEATAIQGFLTMLNAAPFVERYAIYNWVEDNRAMVLSGTLTPAGQIYHDMPSPVGYVQETPLVGTTPQAEYSFEGNGADSSGNAHTAIARSITYAPGVSGSCAVFDGVSSYVQLDPHLGDTTNFTFGAWVYPTSSTQWQRIFDLGDGILNYMFLTCNDPNGVVRFGILAGGGTEEILQSTSGLPLNTWSHVAVTLNGSTAKIYINGQLQGTNTGITYTPLQLGTHNNYLGKSQYVTDPMYAGNMDEVRFLPYALTDAGVAAMVSDAPPVFSSTNFNLPGGATGMPYSGSIAGDASSPIGSALTYARVAGADWLNIAPNGTLSGSPGVADTGTNSCIVNVTDASGDTATSQVTIVVTGPVNGVWSTDADGNWSDTTKWMGGNVPSATGTADFSTVNISANRTVTLDVTPVVGALNFGDSSGTQTWTLAGSGTNMLNLNSGTVNPPVIAVKQNSATISAALGGPGGLEKTGTGALLLKGASVISGTLFTDENSTSLNDGIVDVASSGALGNLSAVSIRNNTNGSSIFQIDGSAGSVSLPQNFTIAQRNGTAQTIENLSGTNTISGNISIVTGGSNFRVLSDAGLITLAGNIAPTVTGTRTLTMDGAGDTAISGVLADGTGGLSALTKTGSGRLFLTGPSTFSGPTTISSGTFVFQGTLNSSGTLTAAAGTTVTGTGFTVVTAFINGTHAPGYPLGVQYFRGGPLTYGATSHLEWVLAGNSTASGSSSQVGGWVVSITPGAVLDVVLNNAGSNVKFSDPFWQQVRSWNVVTGVSFTGNFALGSVSTDSVGQPVTSVGSFSIAQSGAATTLNFAPNLTPEQTWQQANFGANWNNPAISGDMADPEGDGVPNVIKYAMGTNPNLPGQGPLAHGGPNGGRLTISFTRNTAATDVSLTVQGADSISGPWTPVASSTGGQPFSVILTGATASESGTGAAVNVQVGDAYLIGDPAHPHRFLQLQVTH